MRLRPVALALALPLVLTACGSDDGSADAAASGSASSSASAAPSDAASAVPSSTLVAPPAFCDAIQAFTATDPTQLLGQPDVPADQLQQAFEQSLTRLDEAVAAAPDEARDAFQKLATYFEQLQGILAEANYDVAAVDQMRLAEIRPDATPQEQEDVNALVSQCELESAAPDAAPADPSATP